MEISDLREYFFLETKESPFTDIIVNDLKKDLVYQKTIYNQDYVEWLEKRFVDLVNPY